MKRSTETVLRAEVASAEKELEKADLAVRNAADANAASAEKLRRTERKRADAGEALRRADAALAAYQGAEAPASTPLSDLIARVRERAATTGTHDPADLEPKS